MRRRFDRYPRLVLALLLAFSIDMLRPAMNPAGHRHAGGELPHVHLGEVRPAESARLVDVDAPEEVCRTSTSSHAALVATFALDLHFHLLRSLHVAHVAVLMRIATIDQHAPARVVDSDVGRTVPRRPATARGPPLQSL